MSQVQITEWIDHHGDVYKLSTILDLENYWVHEFPGEERFIGKCYIVQSKKSSSYIQVFGKAVLQKLAGQLKKGLYTDLGLRQTCWFSEREVENEEYSQWYKKEMRRQYNNPILPIVASREWHEAGRDQRPIVPRLTPYREDNRGRTAT